MPSQEPFYDLDADPTLQRHVRLERDRARALRTTQWWRKQIQEGRCYYCQTMVSPSDLTMDHIVPLARGGKSRKGNVVPACGPCNRQKKLETPAETLLKNLQPPLP